MPSPSVRLDATALAGSLAVCLLIAVAVPAPAFSAEGSTSDAYLALVERSCTERDEALNALYRWSAEALEEAGQELDECEECRTTRGAAGTSGADVACGCGPPPWAAAAALHTLWAFTASPGPQSQFHLDFATRLQERVRDDAFRKRWSLAAGLGTLYRADPASARSYLRQGGGKHEDDPDLLVALGASYEVEGWRLWLAMRVPESQSFSRARARREAMAERSRLWTTARDLYEEALRRDGRHGEAHLRLGRVEVLLGHRDRGLEKLRWVTEHASEPDLVYLAHLFIGREQKRSGQLDAALASYRAALGADPRGQAAFIATSHALHLSGEPGSAAEVLEQGLAARRRTRRPDAWWRYPEGRREQLEELLSGLHAEACR